MIERYRFSWGLVGLATGAKMELVRKTAERQARAWLTGFFLYAHAQELVADLDAMIGEQEAELERLEALREEKAREIEAMTTAGREARAAQAEAAGMKARAEAEREQRQALDAEMAARSAVTRAANKQAELRGPLASLKSLRAELAKVEKPDPAAIPPGLVEALRG